jgi:hypothetical protein
VHRGFLLLVWGGNNSYLLPTQTLTGFAKRLSKGRSF